MSSVTAASHANSEIVATEAGNIDFSICRVANHPAAHQKIARVDLDRKQIVLEDGSVWEVSKVESIRGWDKSNRLLITQNEAKIYPFNRYALVNPELKAAIPISLKQEPRPTDKVRFIQDVDTVNDIVTLNDNKNWIVHASDRGNLSKMQGNDRVIIGINTGDDRDKTPYLLIDTHTGYYVRARAME
jgi:hypothetical protein